MRAGAHALLPLFLAFVAYVLIAALMQGHDSGDFILAGARKGQHPQPSGQPAVPPANDPEPDEIDAQELLRGRLVDAETGEPVAARVTLYYPRGHERQGEAGPDGIFQIGCGMPAHVTLAIPRTEGHFGLLQELDLRRSMASLTLKLERRRNLPVVLRTPDGKPLAEVAPPHGRWARETWPSILLTEAPPAGRPGEGAPDPLLAARVGRYLSTVHGDTPLTPGSPEACVGYVRLFQQPPVSCSLVIGSRVLQTQVLDGRERVIAFVVDPAELERSHAALTLRVVDEGTRLPLGAHRGLALGLLGERATDLETELDADGSLELADVPAGAVELHLQFSGYDYGIRRVDLHAGERNDLGELRLQAGACVAGHVLSESGEPVSARIWSSTRDGRDHPAGQVTDTPADADWFAVCGLPRGTVLLGLDDPHWALNPIEVDLSNGSVQNARILARKGSLLRLVGPYAAAGTAQIRLYDAQHLCLWKGDNLEQESHELQLLPGRYAVEVQHGAEPVVRREIDLAKNPCATILLR
jgi:hypothetical protein